ncbi:hypothetical protein DFH07DRAFT_772139 [Mycena maculata]|uniref:Uncharacterized protein n=1 Tax=Mycena maculata TaxID=230809 RepID=A0AAD7JCP7_9AGAR|nr:hypothetical protein DFH07DRAFT_772139 [Mycena maculata]
MILLSPLMSSLFTFCNLPVSTGFDALAVTSYISLDWIVNLGLHTHSSRVPLTLPCDVDILSMHLNDAPAAAYLPFDLVPGLDRLHGVQISTLLLVVHLNSGSLDLQTTSASLSTASQRFAPVTLASSDQDVQTASPLAASRMWEHREIAGGNNIFREGNVGRSSNNSPNNMPAMTTVNGSNFHQRRIPLSIHDLSL